jgi:hypothetical protein
MVQSIATLSLEDFLAQPNIESSPAWELIAGRAVQMPTLSIAPELSVDAVMEMTRRH